MIYLTMGKIYTTISLLSLFSLQAQVWSGPTIDFTKPNFTDWENTIYQDEITTNVSLTRSTDGGALFNAKSETVYSSSSSPSGTLWAQGTTDNVETLSFGTWRQKVPSSGNKPVINREYVLQITTEGQPIYIDVVFTQWSSGGGGSNGGGGGFSYTRSTDPTAGIPLIQGSLAYFYPNPAQNQIWFSQLQQNDLVRIYDITGKVILEQYLDDTKKVKLSALKRGIYLVNVKGYAPKKLIKK